MVCTKIYGIDRRKRLTPLMVRDAIVECFFIAHKEILDKMDDYYVMKCKSELSAMKKSEVVELIRSMFDKVGGDYNCPDKESLIGVVGELKRFSVQFRSPKIINKHASEIMGLLNRLE